MNTNSYYLIELPCHDDKRGKMCVVESMTTIPFMINRIFYDYENRNSFDNRGNHANKNSSFVFVCVNGMCKIKLNDGSYEEVFEMNSPKKALFVNRMVWKEMYDFSDDSILLVISDCKYDPNEYIRDYDEFIRIKREE